MRFAILRVTIRRERERDRQGDRDSEEREGGTQDGHLHLLGMESVKLRFKIR